jgi:hypothetical protein
LKVSDEKSRIRILTKMPPDLQIRRLTFSSQRVIEDGNPKFLHIESRLKM